MVESKSLVQRLITNWEFELKKFVTNRSEVGDDMIQAMDDKYYLGLVLNNLNNADYQTGVFGYSDPPNAPFSHRRVV